MLLIKKYLKITKLLNLKKNKHVKKNKTNLISPNSNKENNFQEAKECYKQILNINPMDNAAKYREGKIN